MSKEGIFYLFDQIGKLLYTEKDIGLPSSCLGESGSASVKSLPL
jgi:hypothetical protein